MQISRHENIKKDLKSLRRFPKPEESLASWERLFCLKGLKETPAIDIFSGFGNEKVYKGRVVPLKESVGKRKGYRVIFQMQSEFECKILVFSRHGVYSSEKELMMIIRERLKKI